MIKIVKVRDLIDLVYRDIELRTNVAVSERAIVHGGGEDTMRGKREALAFDERMREDFLNQDIYFESDEL